MDRKPGPSIIDDALELSRGNRGKVTDLTMKIKKASNVWPWELVRGQHQLCVWSRAILEDPYNSSKEGWGKAQAATLLAQARTNRVSRNYSDYRIGVTRDDILTKADGTTALTEFEQLTVEPSDLITSSVTRTLGKEIPR